MIFSCRSVREHEAGDGDQTKPQRSFENLGPLGLCISDRKNSCSLLGSSYVRRNPQGGSLQNLQTLGLSHILQHLTTMSWPLLALPCTLGLPDFWELPYEAMQEFYHLPWHHAEAPSEAGRRLPGFQVRPKNCR